MNPSTSSFEPIPAGLVENFVGDQGIPNFFCAGVSEVTQAPDSPAHCADTATNNHNKAPIMTQLFTLTAAAIAILAGLLLRARKRLRAETRRELLERVVNPERGRAAVVHRDVDPGAR